jgi:hypothetical protein
MSQKTSKQIVATVDGRRLTVEQVGATLDGCAICHHPKFAEIGMFIPNGSTYSQMIARTWAMGLPAVGNTRIVFYGVCDGCLRMGKDAVAALVEEKLFGPEGGNV